jgi:hypothetical protein
MKYRGRKSKITRSRLCWGAEFTLLYLLFETYADMTFEWADG